MTFFVERLFSYTGYARLHYVILTVCVCEEAGNLYWVEVKIVIYKNNLEWKNICKLEVCGFISMILVFQTTFVCQTISPGLNSQVAQ